MGPRAGLAPTGIRSPDRPACSESLYRLSYPGRNETKDHINLNSRALEGEATTTGFDNSKGKDSTGNCSYRPLQACRSFEIMFFLHM